MCTPKGWQAVVAAIAVPLSLIAEQLPVRSYSMADGLASDHVDCIVPDSRGFIWFCTPEGLTRFDGYRMVTFGPREGLSDRAINAFLETRSGAYLVGTDHGLYQFLSRTAGDRFTTYADGAGRFDKPILALAESSSGAIWCGGGALREASGTGSLLPAKWSAPGAWITGIQEDAGGKLWIATNAGLYVLGKDGSARRIAKEDGLPDVWVNKLLLDRAGRLWAGTRGGLALIRNADDAAACGVERVYAEKDGLPNHDVKALAKAPDGTIWVSTTSGISLLAGGASLAGNLSRAHGLTDIVVTALAADRAGNMWAGTQGAGVMRIGAAGFVTFREPDGLAKDQVFSVFSDRSGRFLALTNQATNASTPRGRWLNVFDPLQHRFHTIVPRKFGESASWAHNQLLLQARTGEWWGATSAGLCRFAPMHVEDLARREPQFYARDESVYAVFEDSQGGVWASAQSAQGNRLLRWDPARKAISWFQDGPTRRELVNAFAVDPHGNIWMGIYGGGPLYRYDGRQFIRYRRRDGVPEDPVAPC